MIVWINSQNNECLLNSTSIWYRNHFGFRFGHFILCTTNNRDFLIGKYSSKEKALKALNKARKHIENIGKITNTKNKYETSITIHSKKIDVFQMPQDDEVEV